MSLGLATLGIRPGDRVALISESRPEWLATDLAVLVSGAVTVPVYPTLSAPQVRYILQDCGARLAVVSTREQLDKIQPIRHQLPTLEAILLMERASGDALLSSLARIDPRARACRMVAEWARAVCAMPRVASSRDPPPHLHVGDDRRAQGVMLSHANLISNVCRLAGGGEVNADDIALSFLPLSHGFERLVSYLDLKRCHDCLR